jgi:hypothetical protein
MPPVAREVYRSHSAGAKFALNAVVVGERSGECARAVGAVAGQSIEMLHVDPPRNLRTNIEAAEAATTPVVLTPARSTSMAILLGSAVFESA